MPLEEFYQSRIDTFQKKVTYLQRIEKRLSMARLITFLLIPVLFFTLYSITITWAIAASFTCMIVFGLLIKYYSITEKLNEYNSHLSTINRLELKNLAGDSSGFADGKEFIDFGHSYTYDLDIFGHASVYQFINRTTSKPAADLLALWLKAPANIEEISLRQHAVEELKPLIEWRQRLITLGYTNKNAGNDPELLVSWVQGKDYFTRRRKLKSITYSLSALGFFTTLLVIFGLPAGLLVPVFAINFLFYFSQGRKIARMHHQVDKSAEMLQTYAATIGLIENETFLANKLKTLQHIFIQDKPVSTQIKKLSQLVSRLDVRLNVMVAIPLNLFFFWDIHCCLALEKWKNDHVADMSRWFSAMAEFEVLSCFSNMAFNNPYWTIPQVVPEYFVMNAEKMGHPLIPAQRRINNSLEIRQNGKTVLVTGSNMSGKSTFLRTCGVNAVLALAGAPVCASSFIISQVHVLSSMRISDSLEDNTSSFYAELKKLAAIIKKAEQNQKVFLLLDEILRGTNSNDRFTGSVALIKQLIGYNTVAIVATHDLKLAELSAELPGKIDNYHFDVKIDGEELFFDYKLTPGICTSLNASILMKKMGIRI
jgi:hypothetical protein